MDNQATYINVGKPLNVQKFDLGKAPGGWFRFDILQDKLQRQPKYKQMFSQDEIQFIMRITE